MPAGNDEHSQRGNSSLGGFSAVLLSLSQGTGASGVALLGLRSTLDSLPVAACHPAGLIGKRLQAVNDFVAMATDKVCDTADIVLPLTLTRWLGGRPKRVLLHALRVPQFKGFLLFCWQGEAPTTDQMDYILDGASEVLTAGIAQHIAEIEHHRLTGQLDAIKNNVGIGIAFTDATGYSNVNRIAAELLNIEIGDGRAADLAVAMRECRDRCSVLASHGLDDAELTDETKAVGIVNGEYWLFPALPGEARRIVRLETYDIGDNLNPGRAWVFSDVSILWDAAQRLKDSNAALQENNIRLAEEIQKRTQVEMALRESEAEIRRYAEDLELTRASIEQRAHEAVELAEELATQKQELEESKRESDYLANHDPLTGLFNRRYLAGHVEPLAEPVRDEQETVTIGVVDIDHFKRVNDRFGHAVGDDVLRVFAKIVTGSLRGTDHFARYGGEEFLLLLPNTPDAAAAVLAAERLRCAVHDHPWTDLAADLEVTCSIGVTVSHAGEGVAEMLERVGATINFGVSTQTVEISAKCLRADVPLVISLIAEQLRTPALSAEQFEKAKKQFAGRLQRNIPVGKCFYPCITCPK